MITLIKLGGSLITDKTKELHFRQDVMHRLAQDIASILQNHSQLQLIIGHGSGSFGHTEAHKYRTIAGVHSDEEWMGFAKVAQVASQLSFLVTGALLDAGVPAFRLQPSASTLVEDSNVVDMNVHNMKLALSQGLVPLVHGDVAFDTKQGGTITSTETLFTFLVKKLDVSRIILLGEVDGVFDSEQCVIPQITPKNLDNYADALGRSKGVDVTGGMYQKVLDMVNLVRDYPQLSITIANGLTEDILTQILSGDKNVGTTISQINS